MQTPRVERVNSESCYFAYLCDSSFGVYFMRLFTKKNMKNWKWWIAMSGAVIVISVISPLVVIGATLDLFGAIFDKVACAVDRFVSNQWKAIMEWVRK